MEETVTYKIYRVLYKFIQISNIVIICACGRQNNLKSLKSQIL